MADLEKYGQQVCMQHLTLKFFPHKDGRPDGM